ncbi:MAG: beta/gamma crystallin family protein [Pleurocapsa minor HA4230-MV1]|nr:beta/gamma crystallin family protein [Pleurocapsa minor HA4230-MV1]
MSDVYFWLNFYSKKRRKANKPNFTSNKNLLIMEKTMSNINNKTQDLFALDTVQDLDNESAAAIQGGAAVELFADSNFRKSMVKTDEGSANVGDGVNDRTTSIIINSGKWRFYTDSNFRGVSTTLGVGRHANVGLGSIPNDSITSFRRIS